MATIGFHIVFYVDRVEAQFGDTRVIIAAISGTPNNDRRERIAKAVSELFSAVGDVEVDGSASIRSQIDAQVADVKGVSN